MAFSLSDYTDLREVGRGGMATVYTAVQKSLNRTVAIKKMASHLVEDKSLVRRFENEAKSAAMLDHDNLIKIYDFGSEGEAFYIAMEYIDGPDLDHLLDDSKFISEVGLMIALQAIKGLEYAHQQGVIHRDMKPANILIARTGRVKVLDFGLASASQQINMTTTNAILGTPLFMSPEQVEGDKEKDIRMDIFAVGVLFYRIITGHYPFTGKNVPAVLYAILHHQEKDIQELAPSLPAELADNIRKCLIKDRDQRLPTLAPLIESLQNYFYELGIKDTQREIATLINAQSTGFRNILKRLITYHVNKGHAFSQSGEIRRSKAHFREALKYDPTNQEVSRIVRDLEGLEATLPKGPEGEEPSASGGALAAEPGRSLTGWWKTAAGISIVAAGVVAAFIVLSTGTEFFVTKKNGNFNVAVEAPSEPAVPPAPVKAAAPPPPPAAAPDPVVSQAPAPAPKPARRRRAPVQAAAASAGPASRATPAPQAAAAQERPVPVVVRGTGGLHVFCNPWAELYVDGQRFGNTPPKSPIVFPEGRHMVVLKREGFETHSEPVMISKDETFRLKVTLKPKSR